MISGDWTTATSDYQGSRCTTLTPYGDVATYFKVSLPPDCELIRAVPSTSRDGSPRIHIYYQKWEPLEEREVE